MKRCPSFTSTVSSLHTTDELAKKSQTREMISASYNMSFIKDIF